MYSFPTQEATEDPLNTTISAYLFSQEAHAASASVFQAATYEKMKARFIVRGNLPIGNLVHGLICLSVHISSAG